MEKTSEIKHLLKEIRFDHYRDFNHIQGDPYEWLEGFKEKIKNTIGEILLLEIEENKNLTKEEVKTLPEEVQRFVNYSEGRGISYYIMKNQERIAGVFVGVFGGTTGRTNDFYMKEVLKDPEIKKKVNHLQTSYSELVKSNTDKDTENIEK